MTTPTRWENNYVTRFFGGPPLPVIFRLILLSILIGVILQVLGLDPWNIFESLGRLVLRVWDMGFDAVRWVWRYLLLGAVVVGPIWLIFGSLGWPKGGKCRSEFCGKTSGRFRPAPFPPSWLWRPSRQAHRFSCVRHDA